MGQTVKIINQISIAHILQGLSEGLQIAVKQGLDVGLVAETLSLGAAGSWQMKNRSVTTRVLRSMKDMIKWNVNSL
jgi:3-hydroxyisobutyrate dehydrogenase